MADTGIGAYASLGADINKRRADGTLETKEGIVSDKLPELDLEMSDEEIVKLTNKWEKTWVDSSKKQEWEKAIKENEKYWLGKQYSLPDGDLSDRPMVDNLIFEALETFLPQSTRRNPEPMVVLAVSEARDEEEQPDPVKVKYVDKVKNRLSELADDNKLRLKLKKAARHWAIFQLGIAKYGWDMDNDMPSLKIIRPAKIILDPDATIDEDGYTGNRIGEYRKLTAETILNIIGDRSDQLDEATGQLIKRGNAEARSKIKDMVNNDLATEIQFIEWWTPQYLCWKLDSLILLKKKNPHWNYDSTKTESSVNDYGIETLTETPVEGINHFPVPKMPYSFLSVYNLGDQPMDKTGLIQQNLANQDLLNKRNKQITRNADDMNGGMVVSLERSGLSESQAKKITTALRKGGTVLIPAGAPRDAVDRYPAQSLPGDIYTQLVDTRGRLRDIFGVSGSSQAGLEKEKLATGKIMSRSLDTDRIGGGVSEYLEQFADDIYNWFLQLLYVYDSGFQFIDNARPPKLKISVKEGSLLPKDSIAIANQALELARSNRISNLDLYRRLEYPNPEEMAANVWLEQNAPQLLYKDNELVQEAIQIQQQQAEAAEQEKAEAEMMKIQAKSQADIQKEIIKNRGDVAEEAVDEATRSNLLS